MVLIIYALFWLLAAAFAGGLFLTGNLNELTLTLFGFFVSTLVFMGMVTVLPWWVDRRFSPEHRVG